MNRIFIRGLKVHTHIGVPEEERAQSQQLIIDVEIEPLHAFDQLHEDLARTVDYDTASQRISALAAARPRKLIETLAVEITNTLLNEFPTQSVAVEIRKFILPNTDHVAVKYLRDRDLHQNEKTELTDIASRILSKALYLRV